MLSYGMQKLHYADLYSTFQAVGPLLRRVPRRIRTAVVPIRISGVNMHWFYEQDLQSSPPKTEGFPQILHATSFRFQLQVAEHEMLRIYTHRNKKCYRAVNDAHSIPFCILPGIHTLMHAR